MQKLTKKHKTILTSAVSVGLSFAVLVLSLCAGFSFAWFSNNEKVNATGLVVDVEAQNGASLHAYSVYKRDGNGASRVASSDDGYSLGVQMTEYDPIFVDRNVNTPMVIRLEIENVPAACPTVVISTSAVGQLLNAKGKIDSKLSNIVGVRVAQIPTPTDGSPDLNTIEDTDENADAIYSGVVNYFRDAAPHAFVTLDAAKNPSKESELSVSVSGYTRRSDESLVLYMEVDYVGDLVSAYIASNGIVITINSDTQAAIGDMISFGYDIEPFLITYSE